MTGYNRYVVTAGPWSFCSLQGTLLPRRSAQASGRGQRTITGQPLRGLHGRSKFQNHDTMTPEGQRLEGFARYLKRARREPHPHDVAVSGHSC